MQARCAPQYRCRKPTCGAVCRKPRSPPGIKKQSEQNAGLQMPPHNLPGLSPALDLILFRDVYGSSMRLSGRALSQRLGAGPCNGSNCSWRARHRTRPGPDRMRSAAETLRCPVPVKGEAANSGKMAARKRPLDALGCGPVLGPMGRDRARSAVVRDARSRRTVHSSARQPRSNR